MRRAEPAQQLSLVVEDAHPRPDIGVTAIDVEERSELADEKGRIARAVHEQPAWAMQVVPLRLVSSVAVKHLDAMVLAIGNVDPAIGVAADVVNNIELAWARAAFAPGQQQL